MWRKPGAPEVVSPLIAQRSGVTSGLTGQTNTGARIWGGTGYPPSRTTVARPTRRPPSIPGPDRGSREGGQGSMREVLGVWIDWKAIFNESSGSFWLLIAKGAVGPALGLEPNL